MSSTPQNPSSPAPPPYDPYQGYPTAPNPNGYQPLYNNQPYQAQGQGQYQQPYAPYPAQPYGAQPYGQAYPQYQTAYVATPQTTVVCHDDHYSSGTGLGWILFIIGFFIPLCWLIGSFFICSGNPRDRASGRANLVGLTVLIVVIIIIAVTTQ